MHTRAAATAPAGDVYFSVVSPVYQGAGQVAELVRRITAALEPLGQPFEIILVDDRSPDTSWDVIVAQARQDARVRGLRLSRNFGQHRAITAGLEQCRGQWIVLLDCDLQDQPEEIPALYAQTRQGFDLVFARRVARQDTWLKRLGSRAFYRVLSYLTDTPQDPTIANFGIYHRKVIDAVLAMRESIRYFPTMVRWVGFRSSSLPVTHAESAGSTYTFSGLSRLALDIILAYSDKPLRLTVKLGLGISVASFGFVLITVIRYLLGHSWVPGYVSVIVSIWFFSGLLLSVLGMVGLYIGKTFEQTKNRPIYLLDTTTSS
jgi:polyisoprenyl-phosphate glycosyltransferase